MNEIITLWKNTINLYPSAIICEKYTYNDTQFTFYVSKVNKVTIEISSIDDVYIECNDDDSTELIESKINVALDKFYVFGAMPNIEIKFII